MTFDVYQSPQNSVKPKAASNPLSWESVLKLLGLIIVADKKTFEEEIDTFLDSIVELRAVIDPTLCFSKKMALDWFKLNKPALDGLIDSPSYDEAIIEILTPIKTMPYKLDVITCMVKIACSDGKYCAAEKSLIKKTCLYWDVRSNLQYDLEYVFTPNNHPFAEKVSSVVNNYDPRRSYRTVGQPDFSNRDLRQNAKISSLLISLQSKRLREGTTKLLISSEFAISKAEVLYKMADELLGGKLSR